MTPKTNEWEEEWEKEWREYFTKTLKPKKPSMGNLDLELTVNFIKGCVTRATAEAEEKTIRWAIENLDPKGRNTCDCSIKLITHNRTTTPEKAGERS